MQCSPTVDHVCYGRQLDVICSKLSASSHTDVMLTYCRLCRLTYGVAVDVRTLRDVITRPDNVHCDVTGTWC